MELTLGEVAGALGAATDVPERIARGYAIDSRTISPDQLFFAIRGPRFDGHDFVVQALGRGAVGAVVEKGFFDQSEAELRRSLIAVENTTEALQALARAVRRKWGGRLVAITGSTGKSTTKEMIAAILARQFEVLKSPGNLNNFYGLPLTLLGLEYRHQAAVVELAMSAAGEIAVLTRIAEPQIGVVTNVAPVHLQFFNSIEAIAQAKRELIESLPVGATAVLNYDDPRVRSFAEGFSGHVLTYGFEKGATFRASGVRSGTAFGNRFQVRGPAGRAQYRVPLPGRHNVQNAVAAIATASLFDISKDKVQAALREFKPLSQRSEILTLRDGLVVINDSYNSNPLAMEKMLETLAHWPGAGRRLVVAGEMLELGPASPELHRSVGRMCAQSGVDWLIAVQGDARFFLEGAQQAGVSADRLAFFPTPEEASAYLRTILQAGDVVLVKGSRGVHLEKLVEELKSALGQEPTSSPAIPSS